MIEPSEAALLAGILVFVVIALVFWVVGKTKSKPRNTEVWGTVFESFSHYVQPQASLKEPKQEIVKQKRQSGDDVDKSS
jgi:hypothetical protein